MSFHKLNLSEPVLKALEKSGYTQPTPIQEQAIPRALAGKDLIATAQTGTGKTAAFMLPAIELLARTKMAGKPRILVLTPTRELATQVNDAAKKYGSFMRINVVNILGGMPYHAQMRQLARPVDIVVATPGRLIDYLERGKLDLSAVQMLILDEADRMLDMGFIDAVRYIADQTPVERQTLLFTATLDDRLAKLAQSILNEPERIEVAGKAMTLDNIEQRVYLADDEKHKNDLLQHLIEAEDIDKAIIFSATKRNADKLARQLYDQGLAAAALHGDMNQHKRNKTLTQLRHGRIQLLVATDVAARGIDVNEISHVINYDLPKFAEDYVHRIGRTGRAGKSGIAISLVSFDTFNDLKRIERYTNHTIKQSTVEGLEPKRTLGNKPRFSKPKKAWGGERRGSGNGAGRSRFANDNRSDRNSNSDGGAAKRGGFSGHARSGNSHRNKDANGNRMFNRYGDR